MGAGASLDVGLGNMVMMSQGPQLYCYGCQTLGQYSSQREDRTSGLCPHCGCSFVELVDLQNNRNVNAQINDNDNNPDASENSIVATNNIQNENIPNDLRERRMIGASSILRLLALHLALSNVGDPTSNSSTDLVLSNGSSNNESDCLRCLSPLHLSILLTTKKSYSVKKYENQPLCPICNENFIKNEENLIQLPRCSHLFHWNCLDIWLKKKPNCPICRLDVFHSKSKLHKPPKIKDIEKNENVLEDAKDTNENQESEKINLDENKSENENLSGEKSLTLYSNGSKVEPNQNDIPALYVPSQAELGLLQPEEIKRLLSFYTPNPPDVYKIESDPLYK